MTAYAPAFSHYFGIQPWDLERPEFTWAHWLLYRRTVDEWMKPRG